MEELDKKVDEIFTQFLREELGNRVSQFSMKGLRDIVITEIQNYKPEEKSEVKKEDVKK